MDKLIIGIDPGKSGGIAFCRGEAYWTYKIPETESDLVDIFRDEAEGISAIAYLEKVHAMPRQGVTSTFKFGQNYGFLRGLLIALKIPFLEVTPQRWQKEMGCMSKGDKNVTKGRAQQLFPSMKHTHATADALLICEYAKRIEGSR